MVQLEAMLEFTPIGHHCPPEVTDTALRSVVSRSVTRVAVQLVPKLLWALLLFFCLPALPALVLDVEYCYRCLDVAWSVSV